MEWAALWLQLHHTEAWIIFQQRPGCFTCLLLYGEKETLVLIPYTKQFKQIYERLCSVSA